MDESLKPCSYVGMTRTDWWMLLLCLIWTGFLVSVTSPNATMVALLASANAGIWLQAVGTVAAVFVAIWVSSRQHEKDREIRERNRLDREGEERLARGRRLETVEALALKAANMLEGAAAATKNPANNMKYAEYIAGFNHDAFDDMAAVLIAIPAHEMPDPDAAIAIQTLRQAFIEATAELKEIKGRMGRRDFPKAPVQKQSSSANFAYSHIKSAVQRTKSDPALQPSAPMVLAASKRRPANSRVAG